MHEFVSILDYEWSEKSIVLNFKENIAWVSNGISVRLIYWYLIMISEVEVVLIDDVMQFI